MALLTLRKISEDTGIHVDTLLKHIATDTRPARSPVLPAQKPGMQWLVEEVNVPAWLQAYRDKVPHQPGRKPGQK